jgi:hypothetical protein
MHGPNEMRCLVLAEGSDVKDEGRLGRGKLGLEFCSRHERAESREVVESDERG